MKRILPIIILVVMSYFHVFGQTIPVEGTVRDANGQPLAGMTVTERGTTNQASTNQQGSFTLAVKSLPVTLVFSGVGFKKLEVQVTTKQAPAVVLQKDDSFLGEDIKNSLLKRRLVLFRLFQAGRLKICLHRVSRACCKEGSQVSISKTLQESLERGIRLLCVVIPQFPPI